jgi:hypothetical protein
MGEFGIVTSPLNKDNNSLLRMIFLRLTDGIRDFQVIRLFYYDYFDVGVIGYNSEFALALGIRWFAGNAILH